MENQTLWWINKIKKRIIILIWILKWFRKHRRSQAKSIKFWWRIYISFLVFENNESVWWRQIQNWSLSYSKFQIFSVFQLTISKIIKSIKQLRLEVNIILIQWIRIEISKNWIIEWRYIGIERYMELEGRCPII